MTATGPKDSISCWSGTVTKQADRVVGSLPWPWVSAPLATVAPLCSACWSLHPGLTLAAPEGHWAGFCCLGWGLMPTPSWQGLWGLGLLGVDNWKLLLGKPGMSLEKNKNKKPTRSLITFRGVLLTSKWQCLNLEPSLAPFPLSSLISPVLSWRTFLGLCLRSRDQS